MSRAPRRSGCTHWLTALAALVVASCGAIVTPLPKADEEASVLARQVASGAISDCEALARFSESAAAGETGELLRAFNRFIPRNKANYPLGWPIGLVGVRRPVKLEGAASGYRAEFRKGFEPGRPLGTGHDQAHHFAPYLILGARFPKRIALQFLALAEQPESWGDINLGREAVDLGAALAEQTLAPEDLGGEIRTRLCE